MLAIILSHSLMPGPVLNAITYPFLPLLILACGSCVFCRGQALDVLDLYAKSSTNCNAHLAESLFQTRSGKNSLRQ